MANRRPKLQRDKRVWFTRDPAFGLVGKSMDGVYSANSDYSGAGPDPGAVFIRPDATHRPFEYDAAADTPTAADPGTGYTMAVTLPNADPAVSPLEVTALFGVEVVTPIMPMEMPVPIRIGKDSTFGIGWGATPVATLTLEQVFLNYDDADQLYSAVGLPCGVTVVVDIILTSCDGVTAVAYREYYFGWHGRITAGPTKGDSDERSTITAEGMYLGAAIVEVV